MKGKDNKGFWDRWAKRYDFMMSKDSRTYGRIVGRMKRVLDKKMAVLELACGTGLLSVQLAGRVKQLEATDFSEEMIRQAKAKTHSPCIHFSVQDATSLPYESGTFDAVVISNALHIMPEPEKALAEIKRVLKTGGILIPASNEPSAVLARAFGECREGHIPVACSGVVDCADLYSGGESVRQDENMAYGTFRI